MFVCAFLTICFFGKLGRAPGVGMVGFHDTRKALLNTFFLKLFVLAWDTWIFWSLLLLERGGKLLRWDDIWLVSAYMYD